MSINVRNRGILAAENADQRDEVLELLTRAYWMEMETVISYMSASINPDGVRARRIAESLEEEVAEELGHARLFGQRIKELYGVVPGSEQFQATQSYLQPAAAQDDVEHIINGVIEAEAGAVEHYNTIIAATEGIDPVTQDMVIDILHDEERHLRLFEGFAREYATEKGFARTSAR
jgi:bacterioferritin